MRVLHDRPIGLGMTIKNICSFKLKAAFNSRLEFTGPAQMHELIDLLQHTHLEIIEFRYQVIIDILAITIGRSQSNLVYIDRHWDLA